MKTTIKDFKNLPQVDKNTGMYKYPIEEVDTKILEPYFPKVKIIVDSEQSKEQLLNALEYIHNLQCIDSDFIAVNSLMHLYLYPGSIEINPGYNFDLGHQR